jgi:hypothetical protein
MTAVLFNMLYHLHIQHMLLVKMVLRSARFAACLLTPLRSLPRFGF